jgi:hypothetical protein
MQFSSQYGLSDVVYLRCRPDKIAGMITAIHVMPGMVVSYGVTWGNDAHETTHYAFELTAEYLPDFTTL